MCPKCQKFRPITAFCSDAARSICRECKRVTTLVLLQNRRARKIAAGGTYTVADIQAQYTTQNGCCFYCGVPLLGTYDMDHRVPLARGGTNWPENMVCACGSCNNRKYTKTDVEFIAFLELSPRIANPPGKM